jgi:hypothetical protein
VNTRGFSLPGVAVLGTLKPPLGVVSLIITLIRNLKFFRKKNSNLKNIKKLRTFGKIIKSTLTIRSSISTQRGLCYSANSITERAGVEPAGPPLLLRARPDVCHLQNSHVYPEATQIESGAPPPAFLPPVAFLLALLLLSYKGDRAVSLSSSLSLTMRLIQPAIPFC